jgi:hypothetical protein
MVQPHSRQPTLPTREHLLPFLSSIVNQMQSAKWQPDTISDSCSDSFSIQLRALCNAATHKQQPSLQTLVAGRVDLLRPHLPLSPRSLPSVLWHQRLQPHPLRKHVRFDAHLHAIAPLFELCWQRQHPGVWQQRTSEHEQDASMWVQAVCLCLWRLLCQHLRLDHKPALPPVLPPALALQQWLPVQQLPETEPPQQLQ